MIEDILCPRCEVRRTISSMLVDPIRQEIRYRCKECEFEVILGVPVK